MFSWKLKSPVGIKRRAELVRPALFTLALVTKSLLSSASGLVERLVTCRRNRGSYADLAAREVYVIRLGVVLGNTLLVGDIAAVNNLLSSWAGIDVIASVAEAR